MNKSSHTTGLWGTSIALSWTWGLGLFFAVQFTFQFGLTGLLAFAIPNALGLFLFGVGTNAIANKKGSLERFFGKWAPKFSSVLLFYQLVAISLTVFAVAYYLFQDIAIQNTALLLVLGVIALLAIAVLMGEHFTIDKLKYSHAVFFIILVVLAVYIWLDKPAAQTFTQMAAAGGQQDLNFWSYLIPVCVGFITGPWLDLQQWQRAIQIQKEKASIVGEYLVGSLLFFAILLFHGFLTLWVITQGADQFAHQGFDGIYYGQDIIVNLFLSNNYQQFTLVGWAYFGFLLICILTTLDSGYVALRWYLQQKAKQQKNILYSVLSEKITNSPIPFYALAGAIALLAVQAKLELEYFMVFYATYFVGYVMVTVIRVFKKGPANFEFYKEKMLAIGWFSLVLAGLGYMNKIPELLILGSVIPLLYGIWVGYKKGKTVPVVENVPTKEPQIATTTPAKTAVATAEDATASSEYVEGKWYVHTLKATYGDTNSVGNVYFGMYAMWVGKTRELFFNYCLPNFNIQTTPFLILTRAFEHKFALEAREFETIKIKIRVKSFNRKFGVLEHRIFNQDNKLLGKGTQTLLFVAANTYEQLDIPQEVLTAFIPFTS